MPRPCQPAPTQDDTYPARLEHFSAFLKRHKIAVKTLARAVDRYPTAIKNLILGATAPRELIADIETVLRADGFKLPADLWVNAQGRDVRRSPYTLRSLKDWRVVALPSDAYQMRRARTVQRVLCSQQFPKEDTMEPLTLNALSHFGLKRDPFRRDVTKPDDVFHTKEHDETVNALLRTAQEQDFIAIIAQVGAGKTLALKEFTQRKPANIRVITPVFEDKHAIRPGGLLDAILLDLGGLDVRIPNRNERKARKVRELLETLQKSDEYAVLILDEAHSYPKETIRSLKRLWEMEFGFAKLLGIVLLGQPELIPLLDTPDIREVSQRCARLVLYGLRGKTADYLRHKLTRAGAELEAIFGADAVRALEERLSQRIEGTRRFFGPYPLQLNVLATMAMNYACTNGLDKVTAEVIDKSCGPASREVR